MIQDLFATPEWNGVTCNIHHPDEVLCGLTDDGKELLL